MTRLMVWIIGLAIVLLMGGVLAQLMLKDAGVIMLTWNGWMVETTFWTGTGIILSTVVVLLLLSAVFRKMAPTRWMSNYRNRRDQKVAKKETLVAIESWLKGSDDRSLVALQKVIAAGGSDRLPAAISLAIGMDHGDWMERYAAFVNEDPELKLFAEALQAERLWQTGKVDDFIQWMQARFQLRQVSWLRERFWQVMLKKDAQGLVSIVNEAANIQPETRQQWLVTSVAAALEQAQGSPEKGINVLKVLSKHQKNLPDIIVADVRYLVSIAQHEQAFKRIKLLMSQSNQLERIDLLLSVGVENIQKLNFIESIQPPSPGPVFCRTAGVVNLNQQLWGNAQSWLEQAWQAGDKPAGVYLAQLFEQRKMTDQATRLYRELATGFYL